MQLTALDDVLWALAFLVTAILLVLLLWRVRWKQFPILTSWMLFQTICNIALFVLFERGAFRLYTRVCWTSLWPDFLLQLGVAIEAARIVLRPAGAWFRDARSLFMAAGVGGASIAAVLCWWITPPHGAYTAWELRSDLFTSLVTCTLFVSIGLIANWLGLGWSGHVLAVVEGLTAWSCVMTITNALQAYFGSRDFRALDHFRVYAWIGAMAWIAMDFGFPSAAADLSTDQPAEDSSRAHGKAPPGMLRPIPGILTALRKLRPLASRPSRRNSPPLSAAQPGNGAQP
jgi:hypothetical protein